MSEETKELVVIEEANIPALFAEGGSEPIIEGLKREAAKFEGDISTKKGRDEIRSFAQKYRTSKAYLDKMGKVLSDALNAKIKPINGERNKLKACCDEMYEKTRKPLTDWENAEKKRVADIETRVRDIENYVEQIYIDAVGSEITSEHLSSELKKLEAIVVDDSFEEFELAATKAKAKVVEQLEAKFIVLQNKEKEAAEAKRLEEERLENERIEREAKIAKEAAEKAEEDKAQAVEDEKSRVAEEKKVADAKKLKRQENVKHRNKIHKEAKASMLEHGISDEDATIFVTMVKDGLVKNISINY